jgi:hypothetical protein
MLAFKNKGGLIEKEAEEDKILNEVIFHCAEC